MGGAALFSCSPLPLGSRSLVALHVSGTDVFPDYSAPGKGGAPGPAEVVGKGSVASTDANFREQYLPQMYFSNVRQTSRLRVLVASDIHTNVEAIVLLNHWLAEKRIVVDFVLVPGDMADMDARDQTVAEKLEGGAGDVSNVLHNLEKIKCRVYYVPGNHDPASTMKLGSPNDHAKLTPHSTNMHGKAIEIEDGLVLCGFGGSCNAYNSVSGKIRWRGYPYEDETEMQQSLSSLMQYVHKNFSKDSQILLLTHVGPQHAKTTIDRSHAHQSIEEPILTGSNAIGSILQNGTVNIDPLANGGSCSGDIACALAPNKTKSVVGEDDSLIDQHRIFLNIHGHTHESSGECTVWQCQGDQPWGFERRKICHSGHGENKYSEGKWKMVGRKDSILRFVLSLLHTYTYCCPVDAHTHIHFSSNVSYTCGGACVRVYTMMYDTLYINIYILYI